MSITKKANEAHEQFNKACYGIRVITQTNHCSDTYEVGDYLPNSYQWIDGQETDEELEGTCCLLTSFDGWEFEDLEYDIKALDEYKKLGHQVVLVGGDESYEGTDSNETVISNAQVIMVIA